MIQNNTINVAFPIGTHQSFTYTVPQSQLTRLQIGVRVIAPLGRRRAQGYVVELNPDINDALQPKLKPIHQVIDDAPLFTEELLQLLTWISKYYLTPLGKVLHTALPSEVQVKKTISYIRLAEDAWIKQNAQYDYLLRFPRDAVIRERTFLERADINADQLDKLIADGYIAQRVEYQPPTGRTIQTVRLDRAIRENLEVFLDKLDSRASAQRRLLHELAGHADWIPAAQAVKSVNTSYGTLRSLEEKSYVQVREKPLVQDPLQVYGEPIKKEVEYTEYQQQAIDRVLSAIHANRFRPFLLHGVTGSGKTEIYIRAVDEILSRGQQVIMLVPEIALTPQMARRFRGHFGERVTLWHSNMSGGERAYTWRKIADGDYDIVIGARSAIFAPVRKLGLVIIDEEQEGSYKQSDPDPRYHARDAALVRARNNQAVVILGTATPSMESYYNATLQKYDLIEIPERHHQAVPPKIKLIDMKKERDKSDSFPHFLSEPLRAAIQLRLDQKEQIILLQNRRGFAPIFQCLDCGWHAECERCDISLTYHKTRDILLCHYCDTERPPLVQCQECHGSNLRYTGMGTQRAESLLEEAFPGARIIRMDADSTTRSDSHRTILEAFEREEYDILLGTQMIAKGLDFPNVTLVGVLNADTGLFFPDFRSGERTFQLLAQVGGRSGRAEKPGVVCIQTSAEENVSIRAATQNEHTLFYNRTLSERNELNYPPFSRLANITVKGPLQDRVKNMAHKIAQRLHQHRRHVDVLGPAPAPLERIRNLYHWRLTLKSAKDVDPTGATVRNLLRQSVLSMPEYPTSGNYRITVDIDPEDML